jgi:hypothetical protein
VTVIAETKMLPGITLKARRSPGLPGTIKPFLERTSKLEVFGVTGRVSKVEQVVDHENDYYYKHVEDAETGEVLKHQEEPRSQHVADSVKRKRSL